MQHLDEGQIHSWLDGALDAAEAERIERHMESCVGCADAVAEARGLIAGTSRLLSALDHVPAGVLPAGSMPAPALPRGSFVRRWSRHPSSWVAIAASLILAVVVGRHETALPPSTAPALLAPPSGPANGMGSPEVSPKPTPSPSTIAAREPARNAARPPASPIAIDRTAEETLSRKLTKAAPVDTANTNRTATADASAARRDLSATGAAGAVVVATPPALPVLPAGLATANATVATETTTATRLPVSARALAAGGAAAAGARGGGGGGGGGGGRGAGGGRAGGGGRGGRGGPLADYLGCYAMTTQGFAAPVTTSNLTDAASARIPQRFSLRTDSVAGGASLNSIRALDSTAVETTTVAGLTWRYAGSTIVISTGMNGVDQIILTITATGPGMFIASRAGAPAVPISRIPCTRISGGG